MSSKPIAWCWTCRMNRFSLMMQPQALPLFTRKEISNHATHELHYMRLRPKTK